MARGPKPGSPRIGGRQKGTLNKATADIKAAAALHGKAALNTLLHLMNNAESEQAKLSACKEILDRAYGKPTQTLASDPDAPLFPAEIIWTAVSPDGSSEITKHERATRGRVQHSPQSH